MIGGSVRLWPTRDWDWRWARWWARQRGATRVVLRWTARAARTLAETLTAAGRAVSDQTVRALLRVAGHSWQAKAKTRDGKQHPRPRGPVLPYPWHQSA
ncbi:MAG: ISAzo13-like element transposase-related protein [Acidimicrobiales bacterium]